EGAVVLVEDVADGLVVGAEGDEGAVEKVEEDGPADAGEEAAYGELDPVGLGPVDKEDAGAAEGDDEGHGDESDDESEQSAPVEVAAGEGGAVGKVEERSSSK